MKNSEYWKKRFELLEQSQNQKGLQCYADIERQYRQAQKQIEGQIAAWYQRFAKNNGITLVDARKMLTSKELEELKWDINQYIQYGEENAINGTWVKQLENASARYHISRLEALKLQTQQSLEVMFGNQLDSIDSTMRSIYTSGYYKTAFEIQKCVGIGWDFATLDEKQISKVINKPWAVDGKNFSERIWGNRQKLVNELNTELTRNIVLGQDPQKAIDAIARKMNTSKNVTGRLVMTEEAFFSSAAQKDCFAELDVEQFEIVATLDSHTSDICREMDGKHFPMSQWEVGVTAPPFHVWCRSTTVPFFDDEFDSVGERAARGEEIGKTYYVPGNMTYKQWKKSFVDGDKTGLQEIKPDDTIKIEEPIIEPEPIHIVIDRPIIEQNAIIEQAKVYGDELLQHPELIQYDNGEPISNYVNSKIGYDALPKVVTNDEFIQLSVGKQILYRGVTDYKDISAKEMVEQFKTGSFYCGRGIYGNGTYADFDEKVAMYYAYDSGITSNGEIMEMLLLDDAKTISFPDIYLEYEKTGIPGLTANKREAFQDVIGDVGVYAAIKGYDAILLDGFQNKHHVVILNRSKVIVKEL